MNENETKTPTFAEQVDAARDLKKMDLEISNNQKESSLKRSEVYSKAINFALLGLLALCVTVLLCNL